MNHWSHRFNNTGKQEENAGLRPWSNQKCEASSRKVTSLHPKTSAQPHSASPAAPEGSPGCSWRSACPDDSHRGALRSLQDLGGAGPPPGVSGWHRWCGACRPGSACEYHVEREERWATALSLDWWKRCQVKLYHVNAHIIHEESNAKFDELTFQHNLDVRHRRSNLPFANKLQPQGASVLWFFAKTLWQPQTSQTETCNAASVLCTHLLLNFDMSMFWHVHTWHDLRWFA